MCVNCVCIPLILHSKSIKSTVCRSYIWASREKVSLKETKGATSTDLGPNNKLAQKILGRD